MHSFAAPLVWVTDPHLNHVSGRVREDWLRRIASHGPGGVVISGDISEGDDVALQLHDLVGRLGVPIYFVLGNHDFYQSDIARTRREVISACREDSRLVYLTDTEPFELSPGLLLVGEDGWGDATEGDFENSYIRLNDFRLIDDFAQRDPRQWKGCLQQLGRQSAARLAAKLDALPQTASAVLIVTHVPPFRESCWYEGQTTDDHWAPFFVCGQIGATLRQAAAARPDCELTVLCGHTHHSGIAKISPNLTVHTGAAEYGRPELEGIVQVEHNRIAVCPAR